MAEPAPEVRVERDGGRAAVARVTVDYERRRNSLTTALLRQLAAAFEDLAREPDLRIAVLTGAGDKAFIAGANLDELAGLTPASARAYISEVHRACAAIRALPVPAIARINGYCFGAGLELAAACDLRLAADNARFAMPEVKVGLPSVVEAALLPRLVGWGKAAELVYLARQYDAGEALAMGLVERTVPAARLDAALAEWIDDLLEAGPRAIRAQKALLGAWEREPLERAIELGIDALAEAYESDEPARMIAPLLPGRRRK